MQIRPRPARFWYCFDPICIASVVIYAVNRWYLKPHHIGGLFTIGYLNDLLCLPLFLPIILGVQRVIGLRRHDGFPRLWEVLQNWIIFSILFEVIIPRFPRYFRSTADPLDAVAYLVGGIVAWGWWSWHSRRFSFGNRHSRSGLTRPAIAVRYPASNFWRVRGQ